MRHLPCQRWPPSASPATSPAATSSWPPCHAMTARGVAFDTGKSGIEPVPAQRALNARSTLVEIRSRAVVQSLRQRLPERVWQRVPERFRNRCRRCGCRCRSTGLASIREPSRAFREALERPSSGSRAIRELPKFTRKFACGLLPVWCKSGGGANRYTLCPPPRRVPHA